MTQLFAPPATHSDSFSVAGTTLSSRLFLGTSHYPSPQVLSDAVTASGTQVLTVGLRRLQPESGGGNTFWQRVQAMKCHILPNTAGCHTAHEAITLAQMAREIFGTTWIKLEVIGDDYTLQPDTHATLEAATLLAKEGFAVFAYTTDDLVIAQKLRDAGCAVLVVSEELDELFEVSDRLYVIAKGQLSPSVARDKATVPQIGEWMSGLWQAKAGEVAHV